jgi:hypothetical protein
MQPGPKIYAEHPNKISGQAIGSLAREGGAAPAKSGEPTTLQDGQAAGLDGRLT